MSSPGDSTATKLSGSTMTPLPSGASRPTTTTSLASKQSQGSRGAPLLASDGASAEAEALQVSIHTPREAGGYYASLAPRDESFVGEPAPEDVPAGSGNELTAGLSSEEAQRRLREFGRNEIPERSEAWYVMLLKQFVGLMPLMLEIAAALSAAIEDWPDFAVIASMLLVNALIGFHEEHKAKQSLDALRAQMTATVPTKRDGAMIILEVAEVVPGDVIFLRGGNVVPADCEWIEGDDMLVDTAALTGEPIPRKVPRPEREGEPDGAGRELLSGCIVKQGEAHCVVKATGLHTEIGQAAGLVQEASGHTVGVFETKIMQVVRMVILISLVDAGIMMWVSVRGRRETFTTALLNVLALVIGAVPIALPLVMQVTMAIGAAKMAKKKAIITHLTALQEVASMSILCSDKTGTLTTADMRVLPSKMWTRKGFSKDDILVLAGVASNPANKEDPIDKAVLQSVDEHFGLERAGALMSAYRKARFVGFNPIVKRTVAYCSHPERGEVKVSKGLVDKVLRTGEDGGDCWTCFGADGIEEEVLAVDRQFSTQGYKTVGLAIAQGGGPMEFAAVVPIIDPPREDTKLTIHRIREAGVGVKMVTGDHLNIAVETSRLIGLGTGILPATDLWPASATRDETILTADGFAQVLPKDKREVVLVLQRRGLVVGMTGDGVNDAPALAQAQIGIAVDGATEAARSAADMVLTSPGLSVIYDAVVESRKIFARLRAYVLYRLAATIQIVLVLSIMIYAYEDTLPALYVILLALLNDVTMLPIASDRACPSPWPEIPSMPSILVASLLYGVLGTAQTLLFYEFQPEWFAGDGTTKYRDAATYLQISIAIELLIFSCRTPGFALLGLCGESRPSLALLVSVLGGNALVSVAAGFGDRLHVIHRLAWRDIGWIWVYDLVGLALIDLVKVLLAASGAAWMSAGASGGVLGYPELPASGEAGSALGGLLRSHVSTLLHHRSSIRSVMAHSRASASRMHGAGDAPASVALERRSASMLPYPYNLRAAAVSAHFRSF